MKCDPLNEKALCHRLSRIVIASARQKLFVLSSIFLVLAAAELPAAQLYAPTLQITGTNNGADVSWPLSAYYFILESKSNLSPATAWTGVSTASEATAAWNQSSGNGFLTTNFTADEIHVTIPSTNDLQLFRLAGPRFLAVFQFAIFYDGLLEFSTCPTMTVNGPVHANGPIYVGAGGSSLLTFNETPTATSTVSAPNNNGSAWVSDWRTTFNGNPSMVTNVIPLELAMALNSAHDMLEIPPAFESPTSPEGMSRFYNQAGIVLTVTNTSVVLKIQGGFGGGFPGADPAPLFLTTNTTAAAISNMFPFLRLLWNTNGFYDQRESKTIFVTDIDLARYAQWINTNSSVQVKYPSIIGIRPSILYVADNRTTVGSQLTAVRLTNGVAPPNGYAGFTMVTPGPLYVIGNYNCTNAAALGTTNTLTAFPCALISDALTILSSSWRDSQSSSNFTMRVAANTTVNAAILTGNVPSTGSSSLTYSGGIQNLPRLLEDWTGKTLTLNTSFVRLFASTHATNQFQNPGLYYISPARHYSLDQNFLNPTKLPPGTPILRVPPDSVP